jgi:TonB family protein
MKIAYLILIITCTGCGTVNNNIANRVITDFVIHEQSDTLNLLMFPPYVISDDSKPSEYSSILREVLGSDSIRVDQIPEPLLTTQPKYPQIAVRKDLEGEVFIRLWVKKDGTIRKAKAMITSDEIFIEPSLNAVMDWKLTPAKKDGKSIEVSMFVPVKFKLQEKP